MAELVRTKHATTTLLCCTTAKATSWRRCISQTRCISRARQAQSGRWFRTFLLEQRLLWSLYDYVAFPDDDLLVTPAQWNELVAHADTHKLDVFQPAIVPPPRTSGDTIERRLADREYAPTYISHDLVAPATDFHDVVRYVNFVEIMVPVFRRAALEVCTTLTPGGRVVSGQRDRAGGAARKHRTRRRRTGLIGAHTVRRAAPANRQVTEVTATPPKGILVHPSIRSGWGVDYALPAAALPCHRFDLPESHADNASRQTYRYGVVDAVVVVHTKPLSVQNGKVVKGSFYDTHQLSPEREMQTTLRRWKVRRPFQPTTLRHVPVPVDYEREPLPSHTGRKRVSPSHEQLPSFLQANLNRETLAIRREQPRRTPGSSPRRLEDFYYKLGYGFHAKIRNNRFQLIRDLGSFQNRNYNTIRMIRVVLQQYKIPDTELLVCTDDKTRTPDWVDRAGVPILVMAKKCAQTFVTYPDHTFWDWKEARTRGWEAEKEHIKRVSHTTDEKGVGARKPVAFFRGNLDTSYLRKVFGQESAKERRHRASSKGRAITLDVQDVHVGSGSETGEKAFVSLADHSQYNYLLHIPGRSYAARLKYLLATGSNVVYVQKKPEHEYREYWYDGLVDGQNGLCVRDANHYDLYDRPRPNVRGEYRDNDTVSAVQKVVREGRAVVRESQEQLVEKLAWREYWGALLVGIGRLTV